MENAAASNDSGGVGRDIALNMHLLNWKSVTGWSGTAEAAQEGVHYICNAAVLIRWLRRSRK